MKLPDFFKTQSEFVRNVAKLFSSSVLANIIRAATLVIITRLYLPADIGTFQKIYSIITILGVIAALKYEMAIVLPESRRDGDHLIIGALGTLLLTTVVFSGLFFLFSEPLLALLKASEVARYWPLIVIGIALTGLLQIARFILIRNKLFGDLALNKVFQISSNQGFAIAWGWLRPEFWGLFWGYIAGLLVTVWIIFSKRLFSLADISRQQVIFLLKTYQKFPLVNTLSTFLNNFSLELPVFMFAAFFSSEATGIYAIANQVAVMPLALIGTSVQQVYYQAAAEAYNDSPGALMKIYKETITKLSLIGAVPILGIILLAPTLAGPIFGEKMASAGLYMQIISFGLYFRLINSPIASTFSILNRQEVGLYLIGISVVVRFGAMYLFRHEVTTMLWALSISTALFYVVYNANIYYFIRKLLKNSPGA